MDQHLSPARWRSLRERFPLLAAIPAGLADAAEWREEEGGRVLHRLGARPAFMLFVLAGAVRLTRHTAAGAEIVLQRADAGFVAEASLQSSSYHCDVVVAPGSRLLAFPIGAFRDALRDDAKFREFWIAHLASELRKARVQVERLNLRGAGERVLHYVETEGRDGRLSLTHSRKAWAAELGLTHEALYRALARLEADGVIASDGKHIQIRARRKPRATERYSRP